MAPGQPAMRQNMLGYTDLRKRGAGGREGVRGGRVRWRVVVCQCGASGFEGIVNITGFLRPKSTHRFPGSLASRVLSLTGRGFTW